MNYYIDYFNNVHNLEVGGITPEATKIMQEYSWPGNIRELRNTIEHCFIMEAGDVISEQALPSKIKDGGKQDKIEDSETEDAVIDFKGIQNSVLDKDPRESGQLPVSVHLREKRGRGSEDGLSGREGQV